MTAGSARPINTPALTTYGVLMIRIIRLCIFDVNTLAYLFLIAGNFGQ